MNKIAITLSCFGLLTTLCFSAANDNISREHTKTLYQVLEQDSIRENRSRQLYRQMFLELDEQYHSLPVVNISELRSLQNTIKSRTENSTFLVTPPVMNQFEYNTCTGWAVCYAAASIRMYEDLHDMDIAKCSPQYLYNQYNYVLDPLFPKDCRNSFSDILIIGNALELQGTCSYSLMPYDTTNCISSYTTARAVDAMNRRFDMHQIGTTNNVTLFKQIIDSGRPIVVDMPVYYAFEEMWNDTSKHGIWDYVDTTAHQFWSHATCIVGYDDDKEAFKVMNSMGDSLGDHGFYWAKYSVVQQGCFRRAIILRKQLSQEIEGPCTMTDTTAWYHIRNVPAGATITWSIQNISPQAFQFEIVSPQNRDSIRVASRPIPIGPGVPINGHSETDGLIPSYMRADLTVTISSGGQSYSTTKRIRREVSSMPFLLRNENSNDNAPKVTMQGDYIQISETKESSTLELWHAMYGRVLTQTVTNDTEQIDIRNLPKGVYVVVQKEGDTIIAQTKVLIQ